MSKVNAIRKKALELARKRDWSGAIKEYKRLAEADQSNPNVFNELGDLYLKAGNKNDAYDAFDRAIDAYANVGLHNNAVAVCKKILRVLPARIEVLVKLGNVRARQGLAREAESFYRSYLEKAALETGVNRAQLEKSANAIMEGVPESASILQFTADCLVKNNLKEKAIEVLLKVYPIHRGAGDSAAAMQVEETLRQMGFDGALSGAPPPERRQVITEDNLWTESHSDGERIDVESHPRMQNDDAIPIGQGSSQSPTEAIYEYGNLEVDEPATRTATSAPPPTGTESEAYEPVPGDEYDFPEDTDDAPPSYADDYDYTDDPEPAEEEFDAGSSYEDVLREMESQPEPEPEPEASEPEPEAEPVLDSDPDPYEDIPISAQSFVDVEPPSEAERIKVKMVIDNDGSEEGLTEEDYRSHYDMGMAYIEMELYEEALREYQFASRSPQLAVKSMEMIGLCFLKQGQASLAIKQLRKGLEMPGDDDSERLGLKYNLGLAYEMAGDYERAKSQFEDVYVSDVTFRDVARKIQLYS